MFFVAPQYALLIVFKREKISNSFKNQHLIIGSFPLILLDKA